MGKRKRSTEPQGCALCGRYLPLERHHLIHGSGRRQLAEEDGLVLMLCHFCHMDVHNNPKRDRELQAFGQRRWKDKFGGTDDDFRRRYGKSYV